MSAYPYADASEAIRGAGDQISRIAAAAAQRRAMGQIAAQRAMTYQQMQRDNAFRMQAQQDREDLIAGARIPLMNAQAEQATSATAKANADAEILRMRLTNANEGSQSFANMYRSGLPDPGLGPTLEGQKQNYAVNALRSLIQQSLLAPSPNPQNAVDAFTRGQALQSLPMNPSIAAAIATGTKSLQSVPHGASIYDLGTQQMQTSPQTLSQGQVLVPGAGGPPMAMGMPPRAINPGNPLASWGAILGHQMSGGIPMNAQDPMYQAATNAIAQIAAQQQAQRMGTNAPIVAPSSSTSGTSRKIGDKVTTAKGTFQWNGSGWDPVK